MICLAFLIVDAPLARAFSAHVELVENWVIHSLPWRAPRSSVKRKRKEQLLLMTVNISADSGNALSKNHPVNSFQHEDRGLLEFIKSPMSGFSRRAPKAHTTLFLACG